MIILNSSLACNWPLFITIKNIEDFGKKFYFKIKKTSPILKFIIKKIIPLRLMEKVLSFCGNRFLILAKNINRILDEK